MQQKQIFSAKGTANAVAPYVLPVEGGCKVLNVELSAACDYKIRRAEDLDKVAQKGKATKAISVDMGYLSTQCLIVEADAEVEVNVLLIKN